MGSSQTGIRHLVQQNVAWSNGAAGFYANHSTGGNTWYNNTSYNNGTQYNMLASSFDSSGNVTGTIILSGSHAHIMRNNIGYPDKNSNMDGVDSSFNTWDLGITPAASDFASISDTGCDGARAADGSMPTACAFMHLTAGSRMIDKGTNVMLPYVAAAPDLGAFEYGATGGASGAAGTSGAAGASGAAGTTGRGGASGAGGRGGAAGGAIGTGTAGVGGTGGGGAAGGVSGTGTGGGTSVGTAGSNGSGTGGAASSGTGGTSSTGSGGSNSTGAGGGTTSGTGGSTTGGDVSTGCSCETGGARGGGNLAIVGMLSLLGLTVVRRRKRRG
jgi:MYXO-CTERM domain-containing protein